jgi:ABC transporter substrate binding protein
MNRRTLIAGLGGAAAWPVVARGQQQRKLPVVGFLGLAPASNWVGPVEALRAGLRDLGYIEGKTIILEFRWASSVDDLPHFATELAREKVDVILAPASTQVEPARHATKTIPIVFAQQASSKAWRIPAETPPALFSSNTL